MDKKLKKGINSYFPPHEVSRSTRSSDLLLHAVSLLLHAVSLLLHAVSLLLQAVSLLLHIQLLSLLLQALIFMGNTFHCTHIWESADKFGLSKKMSNKQK